MNFKYMPELDWKYGYFFALGLIIFIGLAMFIFMKKKNFF
jgi:magnesium transporter